MIAKACERSRKLYCYPTDTNSNRSILALRTPVNLLDPGTPPVLDPAGFFRPRLLSEDESSHRSVRGPEMAGRPKCPREYARESCALMKRICNHACSPIGLA